MQLKLRRTFSAFDTDNDGFINKDDLKKVLGKLGMSIEDEARSLKIGDLVSQSFFSIKNCLIHHKPEINQERVHLKSDGW